MSGAWRHLEERVDLRGDVDRLHRLARLLADALDGNLPRRNAGVPLRDDALIPDRARVLADDAQVHLELVLELQRPVKLERRFDARPADARSIGDAEAGL